MPIIDYVTGDLLETPIRNIAHGVNCMGVQNSGIAKVIRKKYPEAFESYRTFFEENGLELGDVISVESKSDNKFIHNLCTQKMFGKDGKRYASYDGIVDCFENLNEAAEDSGKQQELAIPKIASGLGGCKWHIVEAIINSVTPNLDITVYSID